jgi:hypothetical protein
MSIDNENIRLALQTSLLGEIYPNIRMIVFKYTPKNKEFTLRYYIDREPTEDDFENIGNVIAEFISNFKHSEFNKINEECVFSLDPFSKLDTMDGVIFCKKESG